MILLPSAHSYLLVLADTCMQFRPGQRSLGPCCVPDTKATAKNKSNSCPRRGGQHPGKSHILGGCTQTCHIPSQAHTPSCSDTCSRETDRDRNGPICLSMYNTYSNQVCIIQIHTDNQPTAVFTSKALSHSWYKIVTINRALITYRSKCFACILYSILIVTFYYRHLINEVYWLACGHMAGMRWKQGSNPARLRQFPSTEPLILLPPWLILPPKYLLGLSPLTFLC